MRRLLLIVSILLSSLLLFAQGKVEKASDSGQRIVSIAPNMTEIVCALEMEENLVGRSDYCNYPESVSNIESIGTILEPNIERIILLRPTLVLVSNLTSPTVVQSLEKAGINVHQIVPEESLEGTYELIAEIGELTGSSAKAEEKIAEMKKSIEAVKETVSRIPENERRSCVFLVSWGKGGTWAATGDTYLGELITAAGGINAAAEGRFWSISNELLIKADPDVIFVGSDDGSLRRTEPYSALNGKIVEIDADMAERQGIRSSDVVSFIAESLYPECFR